MRTSTGRIRDADIAVVRERSPIDEVIGDRVTLRNAGGGNLKGLCPFHEERTPSFNVTPARGMYHCFGCGVGGDVIDFVRRAELLDFVEAVEVLAARAGIQLNYEQAGPAPTRPSGGRQRLIAAHKAAAEFYIEQLRTPAAKIAREFLLARGFDESAAATFECGFAPSGWDTLVKHLLGRGFTAQELVTAGLAKEARSSNIIDRFRGRLLWPIADLSGAIVGFGARRLSDDDDGPKYLNTPETPIYKKSQVLYGVHLAKKEIAREYRAVVVEGYTDVMACHLAGVPSAVATCGTAFGAEHISVLRRLLMDQDEFRGEVIFTFDGDEAGQKAALRAFEDDQRFVAQTFIAISPNGMDPCDLRLASGDAAVRDLVGSREPLIAFALRSVLSRHNLETVEGRASALRASAPLVAHIKDHSLRPGYARKLAGDLGVEVEQVVTAIKAVAREQSRSAPTAKSRSHETPIPQQPSGAVPSAATKPEVKPSTVLMDPAAYAVEREALRLALQHPAVAAPTFDEIPSDAFLDAAHVSLRQAIAAAGGVTSGKEGPEWIDLVGSVCIDDSVKVLVTRLAVEPLSGSNEGRYAGVVLARLRELAVTRQISILKSRLQRMNPLEKAQEYTALFEELVSLEQQKRTLREQAIGDL